MTVQDRLKQVRVESGQTQQQFSASIGLKRDNYAQIESGKQKPSLETLAAIVRVYNRTYTWLIEGKEHKSKGEHASQSANAHPNAHLNAHPSPKKGAKGVVMAAEPSGVPYARSQEVVLDTSGHRLVPIVDIRAAAGEGYLNPETIEETDVFRLPPRLIKGKNPLCIRIKGPSMAPTFQDGGYVIITLLERSEWLNMKNEWVYVVVDVEGKTYIKRVKNRFSGAKGGFVVLTSDNPDKQSHPNFNLHPEEISFIWNVEMYFTHKMPNIHDQYYTRLQSLEDQFQEMRDQFQQYAKRLK